MATFGRVIEPTGPLPPAVYRRRRVLAAAGAVVSLVLAVWLVGALIGRGDPSTTSAAASSAPPPPPERPVVASSSATTSPPPPAPDPPRPTAAAPPSPAPPPGPPPPCEDAHLVVRAEVERAEFPAGQPVRFRIAVSNAGPLPCTREIGRAVRELVVTGADGTRLWSSNDCTPAEGSEVRIIQPGEVFEYGVKWLGSTSEPGCASPSRLGPGDYLLIARVAGKAGDPVVFRMT